MCQRKIIRLGKPNEITTVPLLNGCNCPMIKEFRTIAAPDMVPKVASIESTRATKNIRTKYSLPHMCFDMLTELKVDGANIKFRHCECANEIMVCSKLPPLFSPHKTQEDEQDDDDFDWGIGPGDVPVHRH